MLQPFDLKLRDPVDTSRVAVVDSLHEIRVNSEIFYFANKKTMKEFRKHVVRYAGLITDPVKQVRFMPTESNPRQDYGDAILIFATAENQERFKEAPEVYGRIR